MKRIIIALLILTSAFNASAQDSPKVNKPVQVIYNLRFTGQQVVILGIMLEKSRVPYPDVKALLDFINGQIDYQNRQMEAADTTGNKKPIIKKPKEKAKKAREGTTGKAD